MPDRTEEFIRLALADRQRPQPAPTLVSDILTIVRAQERARQTRRRWLSRALLSVYWIAAGTGSIGIFWSLAGSVAWARVPTVLVPLTVALLLWYLPCLQWLAHWSARLLQALPPPDRSDPHHQGAGL